jgi:hypothetical protein
MTSIFGIKVTDKRLAFRRSERQQCNTASSFDSGGEHALMTSAIPGDPAGRHLSPFGNELGNDPQIFVIDGE